MILSRCSVAIMAHPDRAEWVADLRAALRPFEPTVVWDRHGNEWDTGRRALLAYEPEATHHVVLQDDAVPCRDLIPGIEAALDAIPDPARAALGLYLGQTKPRPGKIAQAVAAADDAEAVWIVLRELLWGVGVVLPVWTIPPLVREQDRSGLPEYDRRISRWLVRAEIPVWYPWPSLVDHRDGPSLLAHGGGERRAWRFLGADASALGVEWWGPVHVAPVRRAQRPVHAVSRRPGARERRPG